MLSAVSGPPTSACAASVALMVEPPTPVSAIPARVTTRTRHLERDGDAGGREVADAALQLQVAAGDRPLRSGDHGLDGDLVVGERVLERAGHELARSGCCAGRWSPAPMT